MQSRLMVQFGFAIAFTTHIMAACDGYSLDPLKAGLERLENVEIRASKSCIVLVGKACLVAARYKAASRKAAKLAKGYTA